MSIEIHGRSGCPFAWRARLAAEEKGTSFSFIAFDRDPPDAGVERNPERKSPLLVHGGLSLPESMVIVQYLDEAFPGPQLTPAEPRARAEMRLAMLQLERLGADARPGAVLEGEARQRVEGALRTLDALLDNRPFLGGDQPCVADLQIWPMLAGLFLALKLPVPAGRVAAYWERVSTRASYLATRPPWAC